MSSPPMNQPASDFDPLPTPELPTEPVALVAAPPSPEDQVAADLRAVADIARAHADLCAEIEKRIVGQRKVVEHLLTALFARGHCLFVGVPGLAKTLLVQTTASSLGL